ncbi:MAG TPA: hypothetical protein VKN36_13180 [Eudoraea sp.]|nr:hypothetical protein [Eudoraea sp.]
MKINKNEIPVAMRTPDSTMRNLRGYGGMTIDFNEIPKGTDFTPLLQGLKNNSCHCPHWGYIVKGTMRVIYDDNSEEVVSTGDVFNLPAGHTAIVEEDVKLIDFSPEKEFGELMAHIVKKMAEFEE